MIRFAFQRITSIIVEGHSHHLGNSYGPGLEEGKVASGSHILILLVESG